MEVVWIQLMVGTTQVLASVASDLQYAEQPAKMQDLGNLGDHDSVAAEKGGLWV